MTIKGELTFQHAPMQDHKPNSIPVALMGLNELLKLDDTELLDMEYGMVLRGYGEGR